VGIVEGDDTGKVKRGESRGETSDTNDILTFELVPGREYTLRVGDPVRQEKKFKVAQQPMTLEIELDALADKELTAEQRQAVEKAARDFFAVSERQQADMKFDAALDKLVALHETAVRQLVWQVYQSAPAHEALKKDFESKQVRNKEYLSPYTVKQVGKKPKNGWPLFIAMHGGGNAPKALNDSQWKI